MVKLLDRAPDVDESTYVSESAEVIGDVKIGRNVFIAPTAVVRADEPNSAITISDNCNVQDGAIIHSLRGSKVEIGKGTSLSHGCIVHGPCRVGRKCFIGFGAVVFNSTVGDGSVVMHRALVVDVEIPLNKLVPQGSVIDKQEKISNLETVPQDIKRFVDSVVVVNLELAKEYLSTNKAYTPNRLRHWKKKRRTGM
jgi:carbonic anhydrase/acetyltransferase-like protein (isoleucine patch superfamily)